MKELDNVNNININELYNEIARKIETCKRNIQIQINNEMTILYWNIGKVITENVLNNDKAEYGKSVINNLSKKLISKYGRGYSRANIFRMMKLYGDFSDFEIFSTLSRKLSWSHFVELLQIENKLKREFYATMCVNENWSVRTLRERIGSALFERTAISKKPEQTIINELKLLNEENKMSTDLFFRDPYILDFLDLKDTYSEKDLESAIISELEKFILEMGSDFAFLARQKRITVDGEERPIAIILCASKSNMMAELLELDNSDIHVAQYLTGYVSKDMLEEKLMDSIEKAKIQLEQRKKLNK